MTKNIKKHLDTPDQTRKKPLLKNEVKLDHIPREGNRKLAMLTPDDSIRAFRGRLQGSTASLLRERRKEQK